MFEIEWNGEDPRRKASTIHGWLCKMRGTIMGNEAVRRQGRHEMKRAKANRRAGRKVRRQGSIFSLFRGVGNRKRGSSSRGKHSASSARPSTRRGGGARSKSSSSKPAPVRRSTTRHPDNRLKPPTRHSSEPTKRHARGGGSGGGGSRRRPELSRYRSQPNPSRHQTVRRSSGKR